jgi:anti-sigma regulatory factor (Ser/Thr protein kinase)
MLRYHMAVITGDNALRREVKRVTTSTGSSAEFLPDVGALKVDPAQPLHLVIFDARTTNPPKGFPKSLPADTKVMYIVQGDGLIQKLPLLEDDRVTSLFNHDARFDDDEFIATATKALRGEIFGLAKYLPWGVTSLSMTLKNHKDKVKAIEVLLEYATLEGCRGGVRDRIQLVCDELLTNALYHAPVDAQGKELYAGKTLKELAQLEEVPAIRAQYGCSGRYFGVSVRDGGGSLKREKLLDYIKRAQTGATIESKASGAGLGLVSVMSSVSKLVFNLEPGSSTEVVALFDMELFAKGKMGARSLHVFTGTSGVVDQRENDRGPGARRPQPKGAGVRVTNPGMWALAAVLLAILAGLSTAWIMKRGSSASADQTVPCPK